MLFMLEKKFMKKVVKDYIILKINLVIIEIEILVIMLIYQMIILKMEVRV